VAPSSRRPSPVEAVEALGLKVGDAAYAVIKASDVMVGKD
jgi:molybdopterin-binding protein